MKKLSIFIIVAALIVSGCSKSFYDVNTNPNTSTSASVELVLSTALKITGARQINNMTFASQWCGYWAPSGSYAISSSDLSSYRETTDFAEGFGLWTNAYDNLEDYNYIEKSATANNQYFYIAAAKTMKAYQFQQLVDNFNNVPYTEALAGVANITPKYDKGQAIYEALSTDLGAAVTLFQRADAIGSSTQDILFAGDRNKWAKFANTLRLRILIRQSQMSGRAAYIQTEINKIVANTSGFLTTDAAVNPGYSNSSGKQNPFYGSAYSVAGIFTQDFWRANAYTVAFCNGNGDPRLGRLYAPITGGSYVGCVPGASGNPVGSLSSTWGPGVLVSVSQPAVIMGAAESYLLQAEAALRGWLPSVNANTAFNSGVTANFAFLGLSAGAASTYTSQNNTQTNYSVCATDAQRLACIIRQKWMAFHDVTPYEAWCDYRRTGYPADMLLSVNPGRDANNIPVRMLYPTIEYTTNAANATAEGTIDHHTTKVFWNQ